LKRGGILNPLLLELVSEASCGAGIGGRGKGDGGWRGGGGEKGRGEERRRGK